MFRRASKLLAWLGIGLGGAHILYGVYAFRALTAELVWFMGAGVGMICAGQANLKTPCLFQSAILAIYLAVMASVLPLPQVFFGLVLFTGLTLLAMRSSQTPKHIK